MIGNTGLSVDHVAIVQIMKAKTEPAATRIMRLLDRLSAYSFNLYYVKGRDMILANYLSTWILRNSAKFLLHGYIQRLVGH